jgi:hypothetical protein
MAVRKVGSQGAYATLCMENLPVGYITGIGSRDSANRARSRMLETIKRMLINGGVWNGITI